MAVVAAAASSAAVRTAPPGLVVGLAVAAGLGLFWSVASLAATWWVYDHRRVYEQIPAELSPVGRWAAVHAGFDDATPRLAGAIGCSPVAVVELRLHQSARASLRRARHVQRSGERRDPSPAARTLRVRRDDVLRAAPDVEARPAGALRATPDRFPLPDCAVDTVFVTFAAHEVRDRHAQQAIFRELGRVLRPGGRLVLTEHMRDLANFTVFGPGAFHFQPARTWHRRATEAGLTLVADTTISPFVHRLTWQR